MSIRSTVRRDRNLPATQELLQGLGYDPARVRDLHGDNACEWDEEASTLILTVMEADEDGSWPFRRWNDDEGCYEVALRVDHVPVAPERLAAYIAAVDVDRS